MRIQPHHQFFDFHTLFNYSIESFTEPWVCRFFAFCFQKLFPTFGNFDNFRSNSRKLIVDYLKLAGFELLPTSKVEIEKSVLHWMNHPRILISEIYSPNVLRNRFTVLWLRKGFSEGFGSRQVLTGLGCVKVSCKNSFSTKNATGSKIAPNFQKHDQNCVFSDIKLVKTIVKQFRNPYQVT